MRRGWTGAVAVVVLLAAGVAVAAAVGFGSAGTDAPAATDLPPATAQVTRQTILDTDEVPGNLGYGTTTTLVGRIPGVITRVPLAGDIIGRGQSIYGVDTAPVVLLYGEVTAYRTLRRGVTGPDVRQLADNLRRLGYGGSAVGNTYTAATATAVKLWQKSIGVPQTGEVELGRVLFAHGDIRIESVSAGVNESTGDGRDVLRYTGIDRQVITQLRVAQQRLARDGVSVQIRMPNGEMVAGRVERVYTVIEQPAGSGSQALTVIEAVISLSDVAAASGIEAAVVTVVFTADDHKDVLTVPIAALVALADGGYGLEVVDGSTTHYVRVSTGLFANGRVEVTADGLREGMTVGMPK